MIDFLRQATFCTSQKMVSLQQKKISVPTCLNVRNFGMTPKDGNIYGQRRTHKMPLCFPSMRDNPHCSRILTITLANQTYGKQQEYSYFILPQLH